MSYAIQLGQLHLYLCDMLSFWHSYCNAADCCSLQQQYMYPAVNMCKRITAWALQVVPGLDKKKASADSASLVEVGPRVCLNPIKIFGGSFGGPVLFDNPHFVSPNRVSYAAVAMFLCMHVRHFDHDAAQRPQGLY